MRPAIRPITIAGGIELRTLVRLSAALVLAMTAATVRAEPVAAALEIVVSVSPAEGTVGRPLEVLVRTFVPVGADDLALPQPSHRYPTASGLWNVLYPFDDYPFDVVARSAAGEDVQIVLTRDPTDASLWRGSFTPSTVGEWSIVMRNFPTVAPIRVIVAEGPATLGGWAFAVGALLAGAVAGFIVGRSRRPKVPGTIEISPRG